ncbi:MAG: hypothetical protein ACYDBQ_01630 [Thermoplasmatota archaeon]
MKTIVLIGLVALAAIAALPSTSAGTTVGQCVNQSGYDVCGSVTLGDGCTAGDGSPCTIGYHVDAGN